MVVELSAVRLLAPWFGASQGVWTNVIGVVLLALAIGYGIGARLAAGPHPQRRLGAVLVAGALCTAWLPVVAPLVAELFLPGGLTLDRAAALVHWGSLAASLVLFLPPAAVLGCASPLVVEWVCVRGALHPGTAGGRVLCAGTLGSLLGTFGTTHILLPFFGLRASFLGVAVGLALVGSACLVAPRRSGRVRWGTGAAALLFVAAAALPASRSAAVGEGLRLVEELQSPYQLVRVVETVGEDPVRRLLQVNEGLDSFQSVWQAESGLMGSGHYYDFFAPPAWWSGVRKEWDVLVLGLGAGSAWRVLEGCLPPGVELRTIGVEIDAGVVSLGRRHMQLAADSPGRRTLCGWDARTALRVLAPTAFDQIVLDTYANQTEIPPHLCTVEFFREARERLTEGGWITVNVGGFGLDDPVVRSLAATLAEGFAGPVLALRVPFSRNQVLYARRGAAPPSPVERSWVVAHDELRLSLSRLELPGSWELFGPTDGLVLTDDVSAIEALQRTSLGRAAEGDGEGAG
ncbi:MAG: fused MFS/spermidine synthase [Planctomycetota bacterium]|jgi:predicted membrane-bound spermidine synthase|nr:fused MFS/spermidine synthase [Planctomycetota bacterium]MDP6989770.1 fused MFS/spermidine synthase [Planctomycetota bacterium]